MSYDSRQRTDLSVGDGFRFGCGFMIAVAVAYVILAIITVVASIAFSGVVAAFLQRYR